MVEVRGSSPCVPTLIANDLPVAVPILLREPAPHTPAMKLAGAPVTTVVVPGESPAVANPSRRHST